jgi:flagellar motor switch protein FliM
MEAKSEQPGQPTVASVETSGRVYRFDGTRFSGEVTISPYDFRHPAALSQSALRQVELVHQKFVEHLTARLSTFFRMECGATLTQFGVPTFREFIEGIEEPAEIALLEIEPLSSIGILNLSSSICHAMIDRMLGGRGVAAKAERPLSEIELGLLEEVVQVIMEEWCQQWRSDTKLRPTCIGHETTTRFLKTSLPDAPVLSALIGVQLGETQGQLQLGIPYSMVEGLVKESQQRETVRGTGTANKKPQWRASYDAISVPVIAQWKAKEMRVQELVSLSPGDILPMDPGLIARTHVQFANAREFVGLIGIQNGQVAVQLTKHLALE